MEVRTASAADVFQVYTALSTDHKTYVLDIRPQKEFKALHMLQAYSVRLSANGRAVLDYSKNEYHHPWSQDCWWDKRVLIYGEGGDHKASKHHPVVAFLAKDNRAKSLHIFKPGFAVLKEAFPFLCTASIKANASKRFPAAVVPGLLYLGGWDAAEDSERLQELNVRRIITVHNNPESLRPHARIEHLRYTLADVDTEDIGPLFVPCHQFIEQARSSKHAVLVHCGAGASRSATLCIAYLMKSRGWSAEQARQHCVALRSVVAPNPGFWRALCRYEQELGLSERSNPATMNEAYEEDAGASEGHTDAQAPRVSVSFMAADAGGSKRGRDAAAAGSAAAPDSQPPSSKRVRSKDEHNRNDERDSARHDGGGAAPRDRHCDDSRRSKDRGHDRERDRDKARHRDRDQERPRDSHPSSRREHRRADDEREDRGDGGPQRPHRVSGTSEMGSRDGPGEGAADAPEAAADAGLVLEVHREGKVLGQLLLGLKAMHQRALIGRDATPGACDVVLEHASVSRRHAHLTADSAGGISLIDLGSAHGTNMDGLWLRPNAPKQLKVGSILRFGGSTRSYKVTALPSRPPLAQ